MEIKNQHFSYHFGTGEDTLLKNFNLLGMLVQDTNILEPTAQIPRTLENSIYGGRRLINYVYDSKKFYISGILMGENAEKLRKVKNQLSAIISSVGFKILLKPLSSSNDYGFGSGNSLIFRNCHLLNAGSVFLDNSNSVSVAKFRMEIDCLDGYGTLNKPSTIIVEKSSGIQEVNDIEYNPSDESNSFIKGIMKQELKVVIGISGGYEGTISLRVKNGLGDEKIEAKNIKTSGQYDTIIIDCQSQNLRFIAKKTGQNGNPQEYKHIASFGTFPSGLIPSSNNTIRLFFSNPGAVSSFKILTKERF